MVAFMNYFLIAEGIDPNPNKAIHLGWNDVHRECNQMVELLCISGNTL